MAEYLRSKQVSRVIRLHAFCSVKGGVGKSTLAIVSAIYLSRKGRRVVVIDADLTGTSLADGLRLCAPDIPLTPEGSMDLLAPPAQRWLTLAQTESLRDARKSLPAQTGETGETLPPPPFFNDVLLFRGQGTSNECQMGAVLWRSSVHSELQVLPASSIRHDVNVALGWLYQEERLPWSCRLAWIIQAMVEQMPDLTDIVFDLPPGLFGFAHAILSLLVRVTDPKPMPPDFPSHSNYDVVYSINPFMVTTPDRSALLASVEEYIRLKPQIAQLGFLVNRTQEGIKKLRKEVVDRFGEHVSAIGVEQEFRSIDEAPLILGRLFQGGILPEPVPLLDNTLRLA